eukprot:TRINITY_DN8757_c0_g1_i11.p3 TRINITY_DN8757_c0_g1~~TRINITY_DN8757_c0_g1_i11.p3  ORF type:complete len:100 (+),score=5.16 TRINITY_DN8757_c0_g1_i11:232-531(+)
MLALIKTIGHGNSQAFNFEETDEKKQEDYLNGFKKYVRDKSKTDYFVSSQLRTDETKKKKFGLWVPHKSCCTIFQRSHQDVEILGKGSSLHRNIKILWK